MLDREKVIKDLEQFKADFKPFCGNKADWKRVDNALAMLKEQGPKTVLNMEKYVATGLIVGMCPSCKEKILTTRDNPTRFCKYCGQAVMWYA